MGAAEKNHALRCDTGAKSAPPWSRLFMRGPYQIGVIHYKTGPIVTGRSFRGQPDYLTSSKRVRDIVAIPIDDGPPAEHSRKPAPKNYRHGGVGLESAPVLVLVFGPPAITKNELVVLGSFPSLAACFE